PRSFLSRVSAHATHESELRSSGGKRMIWATGEIPMLAHRAFCWTAIICGALTVTSGESIKSWGGEEQPVAAATELSPEVQAERNKVPVRQLSEDLFTHGRYEMIDKVFAAQCPVHFGSRSVRLAQAIAEGKGWRSAAPDLVMTVNEISVNGDMVTVVWTAK